MAESLLAERVDVSDVLSRLRPRYLKQSSFQFSINADGIVGYVCCCCGVADRQFLGWTDVKVKTT